ncbi:MAG TPA: LiaF domain-containing protein [Symbiobacteriaceae bacterium]|nr:LiaF domain-containing protein [Symbiobacteriaceae bacterium]
MKRQFWGLVITAIGIMALLQAMNVFNFGLAFWPVVMTLIGLSILWSSFRKVSFFGLALGLWLGGMGVADILVNAGVNTAGITSGTIAANGWPLLLVAIGVSMFFGKRSIRFIYSGDWGKGDWGKGNWSHTKSAAVGDVRIGNTGEWTLDGDMTIEHGIGDVKVDLTTARITEGVHTVRVKLGIGDLVVRVPDDVNVEAHGQLGLGDCDVLGVHRSGIAPSCNQEILVPDSPVTLKVIAHCGLGDLDIVQRPAGTIRVIKE